MFSLNLIPLLFLAAAFFASAVKILREYERAVVFRLGRVIGAKGPGIIILIPVSYTHLTLPTN